MENKTNGTALNALLVIATIGIWVLVFQNFGIIPTNQNVIVTNRVGVTGEVNANVSGSVSVDNTVDVNLEEINGYGNCFYNDYSKHPKEYYRVPVSGH